MIDTSLGNPSIIADRLFKAVIGIECCGLDTVKELVEFFNKHGQEYNEVIANFILRIREIADAG
jgi:hypothetical protein